ncbi:MAG: hypothetical protein EOM90_01985 [Alphaproteobacteria bacterium]|nr:hypothetical protein [Alphaproteobacteria bacterium]
MRQNASNKLSLRRKRRSFSIPFKKAGIAIFLIGILGFSSCLPEQKVGRNFVNASSSMSLMVNPPSLVFMYNHKGETIKGFDSLSEAGQDSALWENSRYIRRLSDSLILENYINNFLTELRALGFKVILGPISDSAFQSGSQSYILDIAQLQIDEYLYPLEDEETIMDTIYVKKIDLNALDFSGWFELHKFRKGPVNKTLLYATSTIYDSFDGQYYTDLFSSAVRYSYRLDTISLGDIYDMAKYLGKKHAGYLFDFFMNQYILQNMPNGMEPIDYFHYNRSKNSIVPAREEQFEVLPNRD